jgi:signal peptidase I
MDKESRRQRKLLSRRFSGTKQSILIFAEGVAVILMVTAILFYFVLGVTSVSGQSMFPSFMNHETVIFLRIPIDYQVGDVVGIKMTNGEHYIKRIVARAGDTVDLQNGKLVINGKVMDESYAVGQTLPEEGNVTYPLTLSDQQYFVLGDNRENSTDSRSFGPVVKSQIEGKIL